MKIALILNKFAKEYLDFTRKEGLGICAMLIILLTVFFMPFISAFVRPGKSPTITNFYSFDTLSSLSTRGEKQQNIHFVSAREKVFTNESERYNQVQSVPISGHFDPNTIKPEHWLAFGIRPKTIQTIQNYLVKGGKFKVAADLQRIYGMRKADYDRLAPHIHIQEAVFVGTTEKIKKHFQSPSYIQPQVLDINIADTAAFIALPGIGSKLASRIIKFRESLGGFYAIDQLKEIYGLQDSVFQKINRFLALRDNTIKKININTATKEQLKHPYVKWGVANAIVEYRTQHGNFNSADDLKKIILLDEETLRKMINYWEF